MKTVFKITLGFGCLILLTACKTSIDRHKIRDTGFVYCGQGAPTTFNPQLTDGGITTEAIGPQLYDTLLTLDPETLDPMPSVAKSWTVDKSQTVYTFTLRHNIKFQTTAWFTPSRPMDSRDVVFSFKRILNTNNAFHNINGSHYPWFDGINFAGLVKNVEANGSDKVVFTLERPDHNFLFNLATTHSVILSKEYAHQLILADEKNRLDTFPVGSGPFYLDEYQPNDFVRVKRNPDYWNGVAKMEQVVFDIAQRGTGTLSKLLLDECDVLSTPISSQIPIIKQQPNLAISSSPAMNVSFIAVNTQHPAINDRQVRRAISYAINREAILDSVYYGTGSIAYNLVPPSSWAYERHTAQVRYDKNYALGLLHEAGFDKGLELTMLVSLRPTSYNPSPRKTAELIQANLKDIGIHLSLISEDSSDVETQSDADLILTGFRGRTADPDSFLRPLLSCSNIEDGINISRWCNRDFDSLIDLALEVNNTRFRSNVYKQAQNLMNQQMPIIPIAHGMQFKAYNMSLKGLSFTPFNVEPFNHIERVH